MNPVLEEKITSFIEQNPLSSSKLIHDSIELKSSYATTKRAIQKLISQNIIVNIGNRKGTLYQVNQFYDIIRTINVENYFEKEIDERTIREEFNFEFIHKTIHSIKLFETTELEFLENLQNTFTTNVSKLSRAEFKNEFERLAIDLSWKSSQIEGNTYSLLETEKLLKDQKTASGKTKDEASMLLNHKEALDFIIENPAYVNPLKIACIEDIHSLLIKELDISRNIRNRRVGISGTNYKPLDNEFQIREAIEKMCSIVNQKTSVFEKAFLVLILISYIQPFVDGNKRTARIISNAILIENKYCPISFRTVDSIDYKKAMLIFYEQNNISAFKKIFIEQFAFAVKTYF